MTLKATSPGRQGGKKRPPAPIDQRPRLLQRIRARYDVTTEILPIGPLRVPFLRVTDPQIVLDRICEKIDRLEKTTGVRITGDEAGLPYWAELWDSALGIGQMMAARGLTTQATGPRSLADNAPLWRGAAGVRVLDLGCGMGLTGTVAALLGGRVTFADMEPECLLFARYNAMQYDRTVRARRVNWQRDHLGETYDCVIGSDVLYDLSQWEYLLKFFDGHLAPGGRVLLGEPGRQSGERFIDWIPCRGWRLERTEQTVSTRPVPIKLFELTRV